MGSGLPTRPNPQRASALVPVQAGLRGRPAARGTSEADHGSSSPPAPRPLLGSHLRPRPLPPAPPRPHLHAPPLRPGPQPASPPRPLPLSVPQSPPPPNPHQLGSVKSPGFAEPWFPRLRRRDAEPSSRGSGGGRAGEGQRIGQRISGEAAGSPGALDFAHQGRCGPREAAPRGRAGWCGAGVRATARGFGEWEERASSLWAQKPRAWGHSLPVPQSISGVTVEGAAFSPGSTTHSGGIPVRALLSPQPWLAHVSPTLGVSRALREDPPSHRVWTAWLGLPLIGPHHGPQCETVAPVAGLCVGRGPPQGIKSVRSVEEAWLAPPVLGRCSAGDGVGDPCSARRSRGLPADTAPPLLLRTHATRAHATRTHASLRPSWGLSWGVGAATSSLEELAGRRMNADEVITAAAWRGVTATQ